MSTVETIEQKQAQISALGELVGFPFEPIKDFTKIEDGVPSKTDIATVGSAYENENLLNFCKYQHQIGGENLIFALHLSRD